MVWCIRIVFLGNHSKTTLKGWEKECLREIIDGRKPEVTTEVFDSRTSTKVTISASQSMPMHWRVWQEVTNKRRGCFPFVLFLETSQLRKIDSSGWRPWIKNVCYVNNSWLKIIRVACGPSASHSRAKSQTHGKIKRRNTRVRPRRKPPRSTPVPRAPCFCGRALLAGRLGQANFCSLTPLKILSCSLLTLTTLPAPSSIALHSSDVIGSSRVTIGSSPKPRCQDENAESFIAVLCQLKAGLHWSIRSDDLEDKWADINRLA